MICLDEDQQEEIYEYFLESESDKIQLALDEFDGELRRRRITLNAHKISKRCSQLSCKQAC